MKLKKAPLTLAAAAAIALAPFMLLSAPVASAAPCVPQRPGGDAGESCGDCTARWAPNRPGGSAADFNSHCSGAGGSALSPDPACAQYQLPSDISLCEDRIHGAAPQG
jgi:hypothetical protein